MWPVGLSRLLYVTDKVRNMMNSQRVTRPVPQPQTLPSPPPPLQKTNISSGTAAPERANATIVRTRECVSSDADSASVASEGIVFQASEFTRPITTRRDKAGEAPVHRAVHRKVLQERQKSEFPIALFLD